MDGVVGMVLAAGLGTRLRPLTDLPKPAVPVAGLPLVEFALARLRAAGARRVVVNVHHLAADMERVATEAARAAGVELAISREPVIAGTGGALREARRLLAGAGAIVLWNGDILFEDELTQKTDREISRYDIDLPFQDCVRHLVIIKKKQPESQG